MKVYLIMCDVDYEGASVEGVYADPTTAEAEVALWRENRQLSTDEHYSVVEWEVI